MQAHSVTVRLVRVVNSGDPVTHRWADGALELC